MARHNDIGKWGEQLAVDYLVSKGYAIAGRNVRHAGVEVDIIAMKDSRIMFVEVKTRTSPFVDPFDAIGRDKIRRLSRFADSYLRAMDIPHRPQFDLIAIVGDIHDNTLTHIEDAFVPPLHSCR